MAFPSPVKELLSVCPESSILTAYLDSCALKPRTDGYFSNTLISVSSGSSDFEFYSIELSTWSTVDQVRGMENSRSCSCSMCNSGTSCGKELDSMNSIALPGPQSTLSTSTQHLLSHLRIDNDLPKWSLQNSKMGH